MPRGFSSDRVTDSYISYLAAHNPVALKRFCERLAADRDAAQAEAVVFSFLQTQEAVPALAEDVSHGGVDFVCTPERCDRFYVEVTSVNPDATTRHSSLPNRIPDKLSGGAFSLITEQLRSTVAKKAPQLSGLPAARVLAITSSHVHACLLMDGYAAECLMLSDPKIAVSISNPDHVRQVTDLKASVLFRGDNRTGEIIPCRRSVSAVLLFAVSDLQSSVVGLLHPCPAIPFQGFSLPWVPLVFVDNWTERATGIKLGWTLGSCREFVYYHERVGR